MNIKRLAAILFILICTTVGWIILGASLQFRSSTFSDSLSSEVEGVWGPSMKQAHPVIYYLTPTSPNGRSLIQPARSEVKVALNYEPKKRGLLWHRTYQVDFKGEYLLENPTPITQTLYVKFQLPSEAASYHSFSFLLNGKQSTDDKKSKDGITDAVTLEPGGTAKMSIAYKTRGTNDWGYTFGESNRIRNFQLSMLTNFTEFNFPARTGSPTERQRDKNGWSLTWNYPDVIGELPIGMDMPKVLNPGDVAVRITYFAPVSLLFFFSVLLILSLVLGVNLHPMNYFFLAAGLFAFQLLFAYLVDLIPLNLAFAIAAGISLMLVSGYLFLSAGRSFARLAAVAQFTYMGLFSYSFFFDGLTGLTITIGAILTLAILMASTAKIDWAAKFAFSPSRVTPPPIPASE